MESEFCRRSISDYKAIFFILCTLMSFACQSRQPNLSTDEKNRKRALVNNAEGSVPNKISKCDELETRLDELNSIILRQEQTAKQASQQAVESCEGDSAVDCVFWTERAANLAKQVRDARQEQQKLGVQKISNECL